MTGSLNDDSIIIEIGDDGVLRVHGDIDMASGPALESAIVGHRVRDADADAPSVETVEQTAAAGPDVDPPHVVVDLADVSFIDSSGLRGLLSAAQHVHRQGAALVLRQVGPEVSRLLEITSTAGQFVIESRRD